MMSTGVLAEACLPLQLFKRGKVRDIYDLGEKLLVISTDRISAFDAVLPDCIPCKGEALNRLSAYWFELTKGIIQNHLVGVVDQRSMLVKKSSPIPIEFIVRGYLYGSAWENYEKNGMISGIKLPKGLKKASKLPEPILTFTTKAESGHDIEMRREDVLKELEGDTLRGIEESSLKIYEKASEGAEKNGIIIADTKFEFGFCKGELIQIDESLTPDSSRFWPVEKYKIGEDQYSFDKQYIRDYLMQMGWNRCPPAPNLPPAVISKTSERYVQCYEKLTRRAF
jgi:phosphoribosylaminoimidazole-succinocarboxamide synthase